MPGKNTLVLGASENPARYSFLAVNRLLAHQHPVFAVGKKKGHIQSIDIHSEKLPFKNIDTITLYLNPLNQVPYYDYLISLNPRRIIFNPGTENEALANLARTQGIEAIEACTLVMLSTGQY